MIKKISSAQMRAARALLRWTALDLAKASKVGVATIRRVEVIDGEISATQANESGCGMPWKPQASSSSTKMAAARVYDCESRAGARRKSSVQESEQIRRIFSRPEALYRWAGRSRARSLQVICECCGQDSFTRTTGAFLPALAQHAMPPGARWLEHLNIDLLPFWTTDTALGTPVGAFPSIRCDDRSLYNASKPCPEIGGDRPQLHERYLVALSRQAYGYGVAFHLTGNPVYLPK